MVKIIPAILPQTFRGIEFGVEKIQSTVDTVQIDFVDGHFAPNRTWWFNNKDTRLDDILSEEEGMPLWETMNYELDVMVKNPLQYIDTFIALGPSKIIFHVESFEPAEMLHYFETLPEIVRSTITFGMAIGIETDAALLAPYMEYIDTVQCMGIAKVGFQQQAFDARVIEQIKKVKALYPDKTISVDGGMNDETAPLVVEAGATEIVVGSYVFLNPDPGGTIMRLESICNS